MFKQAATTLAVDYAVNTALYGGDITITVIGALSEGESIDIVCPGDGVGVDTNLFIEAAQAQITPTNSMVRLSGSAELVIHKGVTVNPVGFRIA